MASEDTARSRLMALLAHRPRHIMEGMVKIVDPPVASTLQCKRKPDRVLGALDTLPLELLHFIFSMLDLKTLCNIGMSCLRGTEVVGSLPQYRDLIRHAPRAMAALGSTGLLASHSATSLHAVLLSESCASCSNFGAFVFLPAPERCCYDCLRKNQSLWAIPVAQARSCFQLSAASVRTLPTMRSLPGEYYVGYCNSRKRRQRLVSVKAAKDLAIRQGRSAHDLAQELEQRRIAGLAILEYHSLRWLQAAPLEPPGQGLALRPTQANVPNDKYCGMASIALPSLSASGSVEHGLWCLGCEKLCREWSPNKPAHPMYHLAASGQDVDRMLHVMQDKARSETQFFEHLQHCAGARKMVPNLDEELEEIPS